MINALIVVNGEVACKRITDCINQLVTESRNAIARRQAMKKSGGKDTPAAPGENPGSPESPSEEE